MERPAPRSGACAPAPSLSRFIRNDLLRPGAVGTRAPQVAMLAAQARAMQVVAGLPQHGRHGQGQEMPFRRWILSRQSALLLATCAFNNLGAFGEIMALFGSHST